MTTPIPTRFELNEIEEIDRLVDIGVGDNRSEIIRTALRHYIDYVKRRNIGKQIADSYRSTPQNSSDDELAIANAYALTEAEEW